MTVKLLAIYSRPADEEAFDAHYRDIHTPLVLKTPGLASLTVNRVRQRLVGPAEVYQIAEMAFPDQATFDRAMASEENKAASRDLMGFAKDLVTILIAEN